MPTHELTHEIIAAAIEGFEAQKNRINDKIVELRGILTGVPAAPAAAPELPKLHRRKMSAAGRKAIAEAQRKRWAVKKAAEGAAPKTASKPKAKRKLSEAGRKAIIAATKRRWALKRAEAAKAE